MLSFRYSNKIPASLSSLACAEKGGFLLLKAAGCKLVPACLIEKARPIFVHMQQFTESLTALRSSIGHSDNIWLCGCVTLFYDHYLCVFLFRHCFIAGLTYWYGYYVPGPFSSALQLLFGHSRVRSYRWLPQCRNLRNMLQKLGYKTHMPGGLTDTLLYILPVTTSDLGCILLYSVQCDNTAEHLCKPGIWSLYAHWKVLLIVILVPV